MTQRMTNIVGFDSVHSSMWLDKLQALVWARPINFGMGIHAWTMGGGFLGGQSSIKGALVSNLT